MPADTTERLLRGLYSAALYLLAPITVYHLIWRGFRQPAYFQRWAERYAAYRTPRLPGTLWVHAVSVGEVNAAAPLVEALLQRCPGERVLVTTITPTGSGRVRALWGERVEHAYLPYDLSGAVHRFLEHYRPRIALVMETELWPNLLFCCRDAGIPAYIVNGRLSERSLRGYRLLQALVGRALRTVRRVAAQSQGDGERFARLGADSGSVHVTGNLKYDLALPEDLDDFVRTFRTHAGHRPAWIAASTHADEEVHVIALHRRLRRRWPDLLLLWAPRHPERFRAVGHAAAAAGWQTASRQLTQWPERDDAVFVIDTLGELVRFYACADVAFVGGSLVDVGGHNLLEPAALGLPVVTGPHLFNFAEISERLRDVDALVVAADAAMVGDAIEGLLGDRGERQRRGEAGRRFAASGRGALARTLALVAPDLPPCVEGGVRAASR